MASFPVNLVGEKKSWIDLMFQYVVWMLNGRQGWKSRGDCSFCSANLSDGCKHWHIFKPVNLASVVRWCGYLLNSIVVTSVCLRGSWAWLSYSLTTKSTWLPIINLMQLTHGIWQKIILSLCCPEGKWVGQIDGPANPLLRWQRRREHCRFFEWPIFPRWMDGEGRVTTLTPRGVREGGGTCPMKSSEPHSTAAQKGCLPDMRCSTKVIGL